MRALRERSSDSSLTAVVTEQIECAQRLLAILEREHRALVDGDADALNAAGADKLQAVSSMDTLERERLALVGALGPAAENHVQDAWRRLVDLVGKLKQLNQRNGALVKARRQQVLAALKLLQRAEPSVYDANGAMPAAGRPRALGSA